MVWEADLAERLKRSLKPLRPITPSKGEGWAAVAAILRRGRAGIEALFIKRRERPEDPWSGQVAFPGGGFAKDDGNTLNSVTREVEEEVGLRLGVDAEAVGMLNIASPLNRPRLKVAPYVALLKREVKLNPGVEVDRTFWAPLAELREDVVEVNVKGERLKVKAYRYGGEVIWGMTARLVEELIKALGGSLNL